MGETPKPPPQASVIIPPALRPGDLVAVVAPSGPADEVLVWRGLGWLAGRYRLRYDRGVLARAGYLAGSDARRCEELCAAFADPEVRAVLAARGGYGLSRFAHQLDWAAFAASPRWIVGFSDVTALHVEAARAGVASVHGPNVTGVGRSNARARASLLAALEEPLAPRAYDRLRVLHEGAAEGPLFGGNLTMLHACAAAGRLQAPAERRPPPGGHHGDAVPHRPHAHDARARRAPRGRRRRRARRLHPRVRPGARPHDRR